MSLKLFHHSLGDGTVLEELSIGALGYAFGGRFRTLANPIMYYDNDITYCVGFELNTNNNQAWIFKYDPATGMTASTVGSGTTSPEPLNHPAPLMLVDDSGFIYVFQNKFHVDEFRFWKSDSPGDITSFTHQYDFTDFASYLNIMEQDNLDCTFVTRLGDNGGNGDYSLGVVKLNLNTGVNTTLQVTDNDYSITADRHNLIAPFKYGTSDYVIGGIAVKNDTQQTTFKICLWVTLNGDFETFENIGQTFSKDASVSMISTAELDANYNIIGSDSDKTVSYTAPSTIQYNDDFYVLYKTATNTYQINRYTIGIATVVDSFEIPLVLFDHTIGSSANANYMYIYDGKIVMTLWLDDLTCKACSIETDLTGYTERIDLSTPDGTYLGLPVNFDEIPLLNNYAICNKSLDDDYDTMPYTVTNYKFTS